ncbi:hypothetical protein [Kitasatospora griseola]
MRRLHHRIAAAVLADEIFRPRTGLSLEETCRLAYARTRRVSELLPEGTNLAREPELMFALINAAAAVDPSFAVIMIIHHGLALSFLEDLAPDAPELAEARDALASARAIGHLLVTELGSGNSQLSVRTTVTHDPTTGGFVLHTPDDGAQKFMGNIGMPGLRRLAVVNARLIVGGTDRGAFSFLVELEDEGGIRPGVEIATVPSDVVPLDYALARFDHVRLPYCAWLGDGATIDADGTFHDPHDGDRRLARSLTAVQNVWAGMTGALAQVTRTSAATALNLATYRTTLARLGTTRPLIDHLSQQRPLFSCLATALAVSCRAHQAQASPPGATAKPATRRPAAP